LAGQPDKSIWSGIGNEVSAAIYRMPGNENLDWEEILRAHRGATVRRMLRHGGTILAVQDTSSLNYNSCLAVTTDGLVLVVLGTVSKGAFS